MALVESFALHARGLSDFFFLRSRGRHSDNAFAFDFFPHNLWAHDLMPVQGPWLQRIKLGHRDPALRVDRFGKEIGHLTFEPDDAPVSAYARGWPVVQVAVEVGIAVRTFVQAVDGAKVEEDFKPKALRELPLAARIEGGIAPGFWARPVAARAVVQGEP